MTEPRHVKMSDDRVRVTVGIGDWKWGHSDGEWQCRIKVVVHIPEYGVFEAIPIDLVQMEPEPPRICFAPRQEWDDD